jgi:hypothetical protein
VGRADRAFNLIRCKNLSLLAERIQTNIYRRQAAQGPVCVYLGKPGPFTRYISFGENRFDGTLRHAGIAIDTSFGINHQHVIVEMKRFDRTR